MTVPAGAGAPAGGPTRELWPADLVYDGLGRPRKDAAVLVQTRPSPARVVTIGHLEALRAQVAGVPVRPARRGIAPAPVHAPTHHGQAPTGLRCLVWLHVNATGLDGLRAIAGRSGWGRRIS